MSKKIEMQVQWNGGPNAFVEFSRKLMKDMAESYGIPYEQLTSKMGAANVSAGDDRLSNLRGANAAQDFASYFVPEPLQHWKLHAAIDHLRDRGYAYHRLTGWCTRQPLVIHDLDAVDAQAILYLYYAAGLMTPRGIGWTGLVDYAFGRSMDRYVMTNKGCEKKNGDLHPHSAEKPEDRVAMAEAANRGPDDFHQPPVDPTGTIIRHTGNGKTYQVTGLVWLGESDQWGFFHRVIGERGPMIARPLSHLNGTLTNGHPRYEMVGDGTEPTLEVVEVDVTPPKFTSGELDTLTHALGLWKRAGERIGIPIRQDYIDGILEKVSEHTEFSGWAS